MIRVFACAVLITAPGLALADEEADQMVQDALPVMYHTCASVIEEADGDDAFVLDVVEKMTAVSLYNRQVDITEHASSDAEQEKLRATFLDALSEGCTGDQDALLAGVVDDAVKASLGF